MSKITSWYLCSPWRDFFRFSDISHNISKHYKIELLLQWKTNEKTWNYCMPPILVILGDFSFMVTLLSETFPFPVHCQVYHVLIKISKHVCFAVSAVLNFCCNWRTFQGHRQWRVHYFQADSQLNFPNWTRNRKIWAKTLKICVKTCSKNAWLTQWWSSDNSIPKDYEHANLTNLICTVYST